MIEVKLYRSYNPSCDSSFIHLQLMSLPSQNLEAGQCDGQLKTVDEAWLKIDPDFDFDDDKADM